MEQQRRGESGRRFPPNTQILRQFSVDFYYKIRQFCGQLPDPFNFSAVPFFLPVTAAFYNLNILLQSIIRTYKNGGTPYMVVPICVCMCTYQGVSPDLGQPRGPDLLTKWRNLRRRNERCWSRLGSLLGTLGRLGLRHYQGCLYVQSPEFSPSHKAVTPMFSCMENSKDLKVI